jgi:ubiquinone/menaquinone biosynthesis C-methylase UbiE
MEMTIGTWRMTLGRIPPSPIELLQMYDVGAAHWHRTIERLGYLHAYTALFKRLQTENVLDRLPTHAHVLDVGIGTGSLSLSLAQSCSARLHLHGVDISSEMLYQSRQVLNQIGLDSILTQQDACALGFHDATFDLVMGAHVLEHLPNPLAALHEMTRVLRPGAPLLLLVSQPAIWTTFMQMRWRYVTYAPNRVRKWMDWVGLRDVRVYPLEGRLPSYTSFAYLGFKIE